MLWVYEIYASWWEKKLKAWVTFTHLSCKYCLYLWAACAVGSPALISVSLGALAEKQLRNCKAVLVKPKIHKLGVLSADSSCFNANKGCWHVWSQWGGSAVWMEQLLLIREGNQWLSIHQKHPPAGHHCQVPTHRFSSLLGEDCSIFFTASSKMFPVHCVQLSAPIGGSQ